MLSMSSEKLVANELLAFLQDRLDVMDEVSAIHICKTSFSENEILAAKTLLYESLKISDQMKSHRRDERGERSLQDIITVLKVTDPDAVPAFVARDLHRIPPLDFDHIDCTHLLKEIKALKCGMAEMQIKFDAALDTISDLRADVVTLRNTIAVNRSPETCNVNTRRGAQQNVSACSLVSTSPGAVDSPHPAAVAVAAAVTRPAPLAPVEPLRVTSTPQRDYAAVARVSKPERQHTKGMKQTSHEPKRSAGLAGHSTDRCDKEGFIRVEKKKKPTCRNQCGTAVLTDLSQHCLLRAAVPTTPLYVSRVHFNVKPEGVLEYLKQKTGLTLRVEKLESRHNVNFISFMVRVPTDRLSTFMSEEFWPKGVKFRKFNGRLTRDTSQVRYTSPYSRVNNK